MMSYVKEFTDGWRIIFRILCRLVAAFLGTFRRVRRPGDRSQRNYRDSNCFDPPPDVRARPDPFMYCQEWLHLRGIAVVWDNPDFRIVDPETGALVGRFDLKPDTSYIVEATIHNNSFMAAFGTTVHIEVYDFGAGTGKVGNLGTVTVDVPGFGTATARVNWRTPGTGGHNCLRAHIFHHDDANPLNNLGQHNTDIALPASPTRKLTFLVGNTGIATKTVRLTMDAYRLPSEPRCPETYQQRQSGDYLRQLQAANDSGRFPVPGFLEARLSHERFQLPPGDEIAVTLELVPPSAGFGDQSINVNAYDGDHLIGGITAYVLEEVA